MLDDASVEAVDSEADTLNVPPPAIDPFDISAAATDSTCAAAAVIDAVLDSDVATDSVTDAAAVIDAVLDSDVATDSACTCNKVTVEVSVAAADSAIVAAMTADAVCESVVATDSLCDRLADNVEALDSAAAADSDCVTSNVPLGLISPSDANSHAEAVAYWPNHPRAVKRASGTRMTILVCDQLRVDQLDRA